MIQEGKNQGLAQHQIVLVQRGTLSITGVEDVDAYDEHAITAKTVMGVLYIEGEKLHVKRLSLEDGVLDVEGQIGALYYGAEEKTQTGGFFSRLFR